MNRFLATTLAGLTLALVTASISSAEITLPSLYNSPQGQHLAEKWMELVTGNAEASLQEEWNGVANMPIHEMAVREANKFYSSLSDEQLNSQFADLASVEESGESYTDDSGDESNSGLISSIITDWATGRVIANFDGAKNESGFGAKVVRATTGISWDAIRRNGLQGGQNSVASNLVVKPTKWIMKTFGWR